MKARVTAAFAILLVASLPLESRAQVTLGPHAGYDVDAGEVLIGVTSQFSLPGIPLSFSPGFDYYPGLDGGASFWVLDLDAHYPINARNVKPYIGGGLHVARASVNAGALTFSNTDVGLNLKGGASFGTSDRIRPFAQAKLRINNGSTVAIQAGVSFKLGR